MAKKRRRRRIKNYKPYKLTPLARSKRLINHSKGNVYDITKTAVIRKNKVYYTGRTMSERHKLSDNRINKSSRGRNKNYERVVGTSSLRHFRQDSVCRSRQERRRTLFALSSIGKGKGVSKLRFHTPSSKIQCRRK